MERQEFREDIELAKPEDVKKISCVNGGKNNGYK